MAIAALATLYTLFLVYAAGLDKLLLSCILYAPGALLYVMARRERDLRVFRPFEAGAVRDHCRWARSPAWCPWRPAPSRSSQGKERS